MLTDFSNLLHNAENRIEYPDVELYSQDETLLGILGDAYNVTVKLNYNDVSEINFTLPCTSPFYNIIRGFMYIAIPVFGKFVLINPKRTSDGKRDVLECIAYSREYELNHVQFYVPDGTYNLYNPFDSTTTLTAMLLQSMEGWSLGSVDTSLYNRYRTFDANTTGLYDFMMNVAQAAYGICFVFDNVNRRFHIYDATKVKDTVPVYLSLDNLIKNIEVQEVTEDVVTCLDVHGADGVDIRSANPIGNNKMYNLDYYFSQPDANVTLKNKWNSWSANLNYYQDLYYDISVSRNMSKAKYLSESAKLVELRSELVSYQIVRSTIIEGIAAGVKSDSDLSEITSSVTSKENEITLQEEALTNYSTEYENFTSQLKDINNATALSMFFSSSELLLLRNYIKETTFQDSTFVSTSTQSYNSPSTTKKLESGQISISNSVVVQSAYSGNTIYDITGGNISVSGSDLSVLATIIHGTIQYDTATSKYVLSAYLSETESQSETYPSGTITSNGVASGLSSLSSGLSFSISSANVYFTSSTTEYQTQFVEKELYDFASQTLKKLSEPSYTFEIDSLNFIFSKDFEPFKNSLQLGSSIYLEIEDGYVINPILLSVELDFENPESLKLTFSNKFRRSDKEFRILDVINEMSYNTKSVDFNKYNYADFVSSGAESQIKKFMTSALDASLNAIKSGANMGVYMDGSGLHLCKYNSNGVGYEPEQIHMINNNIVFTPDNLQSVNIALGKFYDKNAGECWGIVAPNIVGTMLAGQSCIIESEKQYGGIAQLKVDGNGVQLNNAKLTLTTDGVTKTQCVLEPSVGLAIGLYPLFDTNPDTGELTLRQDQAKLYFDNTSGNLVLKGKVYATDGEFTGKVTATSGTFNGVVNASSGIFKGTVQASQYLDSSGASMFNNNKFNSDYLNLKGINVTNQSGSSTFSISSTGTVNINGNIVMNGGSINWASVGSDPKIQTAQSTANDAYNRANTANTNAQNAQSSANSAYNEAVNAYNSLIDLANGTSNISSTFISGRMIQSPEIYGANIYGGQITSETTINVGTDVFIGDNLYMMNSGWGNTGSINFGGMGTLQLERSSSGFGTPALSMNVDWNSFIEISTGQRVLGSYSSDVTTGDVIIRANQNVRLGTIGGKVYINGHSFDYYGGVLYIDGVAYH